MNMPVSNGSTCTCQRWMTDYLATGDVELSAPALCVQLSLHEPVLSVSSNDACTDAGTRLDGSHRGSVFCTAVSMTVLCERQPLWLTGEPCT